MSRTSDMSAGWTTTSTALPGDGSLVEFVLDARECPLRGIYAIGRFASRWTFYAPTDVREWRLARALADVVPDLGPFTQPTEPLHA